MSMEIQEQLRNTLPFPNQFDPKRPIPPNITMAFWKYMDSDDNSLCDYHICDIGKDFYRVLTKVE